MAPCLAVQVRTACWAASLRSSPLRATSPCPPCWRAARCGPQQLASSGGSNCLGRRPAAAAMDWAGTGSCWSLPCGRTLLIHVVIHPSHPCLAFCRFLKHKRNSCSSVGHSGPSTSNEQPLPLLCPEQAPCPPRTTASMQPAPSYTHASNVPHGHPAPSPIPPGAGAGFGVPPPPRACRVLP